MKPYLSDIKLKITNLWVMVYTFVLEALNMSPSPPNQVRAASNIINGFPKQLTQYRLLHGIHIPYLGLTIPFELRGMISYEPIRVITGGNLKF